MVTMELKKLGLRNGTVLDYRLYLADVVLNVAPLDQNGVQKRGFNDKENREADALADKIKAANGSLELTAAEVMHIASKIENVEWPFSDKGFIQFVDDVRALTTQ